MDVDRTIDGRAADVSERIVGEMSAEANRYARSMGRRGVRNVTAQVEGGMIALFSRLIKRMSGVLVDEMGGLVHDASADADMRLARMFKSVDGEIPPALTSTYEGRIRRGRRGEIMSQIAQQDMMAGWAPNVQAAVNAALADARKNGYGIEITVIEVEQSVRRLKWQIDMAAATHAAAAYNGAQDDTLRDVSRTMPELRKRWTELIDDSTGRPYDDRVAQDSFVLHGQIAAPDRLFVMPADPRVPAKLHGKAWPHPPNRPHDRAVLTPWRPDLNIPAWEMVNGSKRTLR